MATDPVDRIVAQWRAVRPDLETAPMATFGRLGRLHALASRSIDEVLGGHGLGVGEFDVLAALRRAGDDAEMTPTGLSRVLMLSPAGMTNRLDRLVAAGLVERRADPDDRRSSRVRLTGEGRAVVDAAVADHVANEARLLAVLTDTQRRALDGALRALLAQFPSETETG
ncbi:MAG TPA: MarR family transcriptional regulator [Acidimicrobiia bacterium]|nr:MarR family transcriptional regulator [Acidimicrobiia bacterium]